MKILHGACCDREIIDLRPGTREDLSTVLSVMHAFSLGRDDVRGLEDEWRDRIFALTPLTHLDPPDDQKRDLGELASWLNTRRGYAVSTPRTR